MPKNLKKFETNCTDTSLLHINAILEAFHSGFKVLHSTESALLKVFNDLIHATDSRDSATLMFLDLTAAFDTLDNSILISRLEHCAGTRGTALE